MYEMYIHEMWIQIVFNTSGALCVITCCASRKNCLNRDIFSVPVTINNSWLKLSLPPHKYSVHCQNISWLCDHKKPINCSKKAKKYYKPSKYNSDSEYGTYFGDTTHEIASQ